MIQNRNDEGEGPSILIKEAEESQLLDIVALEEKIFPSAWNEQMIATSMYGTNDTVLVAAEQLTVESGQPAVETEQLSAEPEKVVGYCIFTTPNEDCELFRIAVSPEYRNRGIAKKLMKRMIESCGQENGENIFLEVRESNQAAVSLYESFGFEEISKRKGYYREPEEDALIMKLANISTMI